MFEPQFKVELQNVGTKRAWVRVSFKGPDGTVYSSDVVTVGDNPIASVIEAAKNKAQGRLEAALEASQRARV